MHITKISVRIISVITVFFILSVGVLQLPSTIKGEVYVGDDWVVTTEESWNNETFILSGNLIIESGGKLFFDNVTLKMNLFQIDQYEIVVRNGGEFYVRTSNITINHPDIQYQGYRTYYGFKVEGELEIRNSEISYQGTNVGSERMGIYIQSDFVNITNSRIFYGYTGIGCENTSPLIIGNNIEFNYGTGIYVRGSNSSPIILENRIFDNGGIGIDSISSSPVIDRCDIAFNGLDGINGYSLSNIVCLNSTIANNGGGGGYGVSSRAYSTLTVVNCSIFNNPYGNYDYDPGSTIIRQNWLDLQSIDSTSGQSLPNARVLINDTYGDTVYDGYTDSDGWLRNVNLTHKILGNGSGTFTPHNVTISKDNYFANWTDVTMNESHEVTVELTPHPIPTPYTVYGRVEETAGTPAAGANISCLAPGYGRVETNTDADGYFYLNLGDIPGYVPQMGDTVHIDIEHSAV